MAIGKRAKRSWTTAKLEPIMLHECRHTFASLLIDSGANPKAIQEYQCPSPNETPRTWRGSRGYREERYVCFYGREADDLRRLGAR